MMTDEITYETHGIGYAGIAYPAANVKVHNLHRPNVDALAEHGITDPDAFMEWLEGLDARDREHLDMAAFEAAAMGWWEFHLEDELEHWNTEHPDQTFDRSRICQGGRSGGWVVLREDTGNVLGNAIHGWSPERHAAWADLAERLTRSAREEGHRSYWWQLGLMATEQEGYGVPVPADPYAVIGELRVTDELGVEHAVTIRREDLSTTNGAYRAIRDECADVLRRVLEVHRGSPNLEGDPYADPDRAVISFQYEYAEVVGVERETPGCIRVDIEGVDSFGFPPDHEVYRAGSAALDRGEA